MKTITTSLRGLSSSLLLNVGLTQVAQKLDPVSSRPLDLNQDAHGPSFCAPCEFPVKQRG